MALAQAMQTILAQAVAILFFPQLHLLEVVVEGDMQTPLPVMLVTLAVLVEVKEAALQQVAAALEIRHPHLHLKEITAALFLLLTALVLGEEGQRRLEATLLEHTQVD